MVDDFTDFQQTPGLLGAFGATVAMGSVLSPQNFRTWEAWLGGRNRPGYGQLGWGETLYDCLLGGLAAGWRF